MPVAILLFAMLCCGRDTPLAEYVPKSPQEQALKSLLMNFQAGTIERDSAKIADLMHEKASVMIGRNRKIMSKAQCVDILPGRLAENPLCFWENPKSKFSTIRLK
jgi:hypothetical protein